MSDEVKRLTGQVEALREQERVAVAELAELQRQVKSGVPDSAKAVAQLKGLAQEVAGQELVLATIREAIESAGHRLRQAREVEKQVRLQELRAEWSSIATEGLLPALEQCAGILDSMREVASQISQAGGQPPRAPSELDAAVRSALNVAKRSRAPRAKGPTEREILEASLGKIDARLNDTRGLKVGEGENLKATRDRVAAQLEALPA